MLATEQKDIGGKVLIDKGNIQLMMGNSTDHGKFQDIMEKYHAK